MPKIILSVLLSLTLTVFTVSIINATKITHPQQVKRLTKTNREIAKQYQQLTAQHRQLNQKYLMKHGYTSEHTTTNGILMIAPYHSKSNTKIEIHTPVMVKLEYQQQNLKHRFDHNNDRLTNYHAKPVALNPDHPSEVEAITQVNTNLIHDVKWLIIVLTIISYIVTILVVIAYDPKKRITA